MSPKEKLINNINAIKLAFDLDKNKKIPTVNDLEVLNKYTGFGSLKCILLDTAQPSMWNSNERNLIPFVVELKNIIRENTKDIEEYNAYVNSLKESSLTSFYTPVSIVQTIAKTFSKNKIQINKLLDPSAGTGLFSLINSKQYIAFEKDKITSLILSITNKSTYRSGFETIPDRLKDFDVVSSNIPFGNFTVYDQNFSKDSNLRAFCKTIHTYFFVKGIDKLKEGGILAFITSTGIMDTESNSEFRKYLMSKTNLISACRFGSGLFSDTEVMSDLIILQKNSAKSENSKRETNFITIGTYDNDKDIRINNYFLNNNSHIISDSQQVGTDPYGKKALIFTIDRKRIDIVEKKLETIINDDFKSYFNSSLYNSSKSVKQKKSHTTDNTKQLSLFDDFFSIDFSKFNYDNKIVNQNNTLQYNKEYNLVGLSINNNEAITLNDISLKNKEVIKDYIFLRDSYYHLCKYEKDGIQRDDLRVLLNEAYDSFTLKHSYIFNNIDVLSQDETLSEIQGLENINNKIEKADIFFNPIHFHLNKSIHNLNDGVALSLNKYNYVNIDYISSITNLSDTDIINELNDKIIYNPEKKYYELSDIYINGNIYKKIEECKYYLSVNPEDSEKINKTIEILNRNIPEKISFSDIGISLGERWLPIKYLSQFSSYISNISIEWQYSEVTDMFICSHKYTNYITEEKYGVKSENRYYSAMDVLNFALVDNMPTMTKTIHHPDGDKKYIPDTKAIQLMNERMQILKQEFNDWMQQLPLNDKEDIEKLYNSKFNCFVKQEYDGSFQTFPELNRDNLGIKDLYDSQKNAVMMIKTQNGGIIDHEVGGGKTLIICTAAYEMKRLGIVNKPLIIGLKANIHDIANTYKKAYPKAKLLYSGKSDFEKKNRENFLRKIQNNDWDCIIMTHEQFSEIPQSIEIEKDIIKEELEKIDDCLRVYAQNGKISKQMQKGLITRKMNLENKLNELIYKIENQRDNIVDFNTMGIDHIFVDESHKFKNLMFQTRHQRVSGLGNGQGSIRALNLLFAIRTIQKRTGKDLGATFLSGTVISNSLTELYNVFNYLRPMAMKEQNIYSFDAWASIFCIKSRDFEFNVTNDIIQKERFRCFTKVPELAMFYSQITDYRTAKEIGVDRPEGREILVSLEQTEQQVDMYERLKQFAKTGNASLVYRPPLTDKEQTAKMLIATNLAKKASLDMRLINENLFSDEEGNKLNAAALKIYEYYKKYNEHKGTQFVFSDLGTYKPGDNFNVYTELKNKLINLGIPGHEIQFIQIANTEKKRINFFEAMNNGRIRVLMGSTEMLGTGVNAQNRCVAIHHLDIPWTPKDLEQRNGRGVRKGNWLAKEYANNTVDIIIYGTKKTLDTYKLNLLKNKALFISQIKSNTLSQRIIDEGSMDQDNGMNFAEYIAVLSGNTDLLEKTKLEKQIMQLKSEEKNYHRQLHDKDIKISHYNSKIKELNEKVEQLTEEYTEFTNYIDKKEYIDGFIFSDKVERDEEIIGKKLISLYENTSYLEDNKYTEIALYNRYKIVLRNENNSLSLNKTTRIFVQGFKSGTYYSYNNGILAKNPKTAVQYVYNSLSKIPILVKSYQKEISIYQQRVSDLNKLEIKFMNRDKLVNCENKLREINKRLSDINNKDEISVDNRTLYLKQNLIVEEDKTYSIKLPPNLFLMRQSKELLNKLLCGGYSSFIGF